MKLREQVSSALVDSLPGRSRLVRRIDIRTPVRRTRGEWNFSRPNDKRGSSNEAGCDDGNVLPVSYQEASTDDDLHELHDACVPS